MNLGQGGSDYPPSLTLGYFVTVLAMLLLIPVSHELVNVSGADVSGYQSVGTLLEKAPDYTGISRSA